MTSAGRTGRELRLGLVGAGAVAARHLASLQRLPDVHVVGVVDTDVARAHDLVRRSGGEARVYPNTAAMVDAVAVDAAYVCVPPFAHGPPERVLLDARVPFFVEKPVSLDVGIAEEIADGVRAQDLITATGYHWRYYDTVERAAQLCAAHPVGLAVATWLDKVPPPPWWRHVAQSGGQVIEQATHVVDLLRHLVGEVVSVHAAGTRLDRGLAGDVDDACAATLRFSSGAVASLASTSLLGWKHRARVELYADGVAISLDEDDLVVRRLDGQERQAPRNDAKGAADAAFVTAVRTGDAAGIRVPYEEALATHRVATAIARAATTGDVIELSGPARAA
jgi:myo-inositol 2-dehydrogenase / D-chiro-inositol 1-dehydrogenase